MDRNIPSSKFGPEKRTMRHPSINNILSAFNSNQKSFLGLGRQARKNVGAPSHQAGHHVAVRWTMWHKLERRRHNTQQFSERPLLFHEQQGSLARLQVFNKPVPLLWQVRAYVVALEIKTD